MSNTNKIIVKLGDVADFISGYAFKRKDFVREGIPLVKITNIGDYHNSREYISKNTKIDPKFIINYGDILIAMSGSIGKIGRYPLKNYSYLNQRVGKIFPNNKNLIHPDFLYHVISSEQILKKLSLNSAGGGLSNISQDQILDLEIEIPKDIEEQKRIAGILSNVDKAIKLAEEEYEQLNRLLTGFMNDSFSKLFLNEVEVVKLDGLGEVSRGKSKHRPRNDASLFGGKYPFIQTGDISNSILFVEKYNTTYNEKGLKQSKLWKKGTLCITIAANIAETAILNFDSCFPDSIIGFVPSDSINVFYVKMHLDYLKQKLLQAAVGGGQMNLNTEKLLSFDFFKPSKKEQDKLGDTFLLFHSILFSKKNEINKLIDLKKALLQNMIK